MSVGQGQYRLCKDVIQCLQDCDLMRLQTVYCYCWLSDVGDGPVQQDSCERE